jgi:hypothetical protein
VRTSSFEKRKKKKKSHLTNQTEICNAQYLGCKTLSTCCMGI